MPQFMWDPLRSPLMLRMPIRDGTRARYFVERFKRLPIERREAFLRDQLAKGIITDDVIDQVAEMMLR